MDSLMLETALSEQDIRTLNMWKRQQYKRIEDAEASASLLREEIERLKRELAQWKRR